MAFLLLYHNIRQMSTPTKFKVNEDLLKSIQAVGDAVIDVEELTKSLQTERNSTSRHIHRNFISGKENKRTGVVLTEFKATHYLIECGFCIINDYFEIY